MRLLGNSLWFRAAVAVITTLAPVLPAAAQEPSAADDLTKQSVAALTVRLADLVKQPQFVWYPIEVLEVASEDFLGIPLEAISRVSALIEPPMGDQIRYAIILRSESLISFDKFRHELTEHAEVGELLGRPLLASRDKMSPSLCLFDDHTLAVGPRLFLKSLLRRRGNPSDAMADAMLSSGGASDHVRGALLLEPLRPLLDVGLRNPPPNADPTALEFAKSALLIDRLVLSASYEEANHHESLTVIATDKKGGDRIESLMLEAWSVAREALANDEKFRELRDHQEATARAFYSYMDRMIDLGAEVCSALRTSETEFVIRVDRVGEEYAKVYSFAAVGVMVALLLPAVQADREAARRAQSINNLKQLSLALLNYESATGRLPAQAICANDGTPLLSWRVAVLPFLEEQDLYEEFHLNEPWDSPHNKPLLAKMPMVFLDPSSPRLSTQDGKTHYLGVAGPDCYFIAGAEGRRLREITDGLSRTLMTVQVDDDHAIPWTKPADYRPEAHAENPFGGIGTLHPGVFLAGRGDGSVFSIPADADGEVIRAACTVAGGEEAEDPR